MKLLLFIVIALILNGCAKNQELKQLVINEYQIEDLDMGSYLDYTRFTLSGHCTIGTRKTLGEAVQITDDFNELKTFAKKGRGPGELISPTSIRCTEKFIYIMDEGKKSIEVFNHDLHFEKSIQPQLPFISFEVYTDDIIYLSSFDMLSLSIVKLSGEGFAVEEFIHVETSNVPSDLTAFLSRDQNYLYVKKLFTNEFYQISFENHSLKKFTNPYLNDRATLRQAGEFRIPSRVVWNQLFTLNDIIFQLVQITDTESALYKFSLDGRISSIIHLAKPVNLIVINEKELKLFGNGKKSVITKDSII